MPLLKKDAQNALLLLENYKKKLDSKNERHTEPLKFAIDKVIDTFKSDLFKALLDIQEYYETTLIEETIKNESIVTGILTIGDECDKNIKPTKEEYNCYETGEFMVDEDEMKYDTTSDSSSSSPLDEKEERVRKNGKVIKGKKINLRNKKDSLKSQNHVLEHVNHHHHHHHHCKKNSNKRGNDVEHSNIKANGKVTREDPDSRIHKNEKSHKYDKNNKKCGNSNFKKFDLGNDVGTMPNNINGNHDDVNGRFKKGYSNNDDHDKKYHEDTKNSLDFKKTNQDTIIVSPVTTITGRNEQQTKHDGMNNLDDENNGGGEFTSDLDSQASSSDSYSVSDSDRGNSYTIENDLLTNKETRVDSSDKDNHLHTNLDINGENRGIRRTEMNRTNLPPKDKAGEHSEKCIVKNKLSESYGRDSSFLTWEYHTITLDKHGKGLGFSISGGTDNNTSIQFPAGHNLEIGSSIVLTKLIPGGTALKDGRLKMDDIILKVNQMDLTNVTHDEAVEILKKSINIVTLHIKRKKLVQDHMIITLKKGDLGLGFSISGGVGNEHKADDCGIYITKIIPGGVADLNGQLRVEDKLLKVNDIDLSHTSHEYAVLALKSLKNDISVQLLVYREEEQDKVTNKNTSSIIRCDLNEYTDTNPNLFPSPKISYSSSLKHQQNDEIDHVNTLSHDDHHFGTPIIPLEMIAVKKQQKYRSPLITELRQKLNIRDEESEMASGEEKNDQDIEKDAIDLKIRHTGNVLCLENGMNMESNLNNVGSSPRVLRKLEKRYHKSAIRRVVLNRCPNYQNLGFDIIGGHSRTLEQCKTQPVHPKDGIFISHLLENGPATLSNRIYVGDQILAVNEVDLTQCGHEEASRILKNAGAIVTLYLMENLQDFKWYENSRTMSIGDSNIPITEGQKTPINPEPRGDSDHHDKSSSLLSGSLKTSQKRCLYVRALFDYDPSKDRSDLPGPGLPFKTGDLLDLLNASDDQWWKARKFIPQRDFYSFPAIDNSYLAYDRLPFGNQPYDSHHRVDGDAKAGGDNGIKINGNGMTINGIHNHADQDHNTENHVNDGENSSGINIGLIPSFNRVRRKEKYRNKTVKFKGNFPKEESSINDISFESYKSDSNNPFTNDNSKKKKNNFTLFTKKFPFTKGREYLLNEDPITNTNIVTTNSKICEKFPNIISESDNSLNKLTDEFQYLNNNNEHLLSYQPVTLKPIPYKRPIILLGPLKDRIGDELIQKYPETFANCIPHTTRTMRPHEIDGRDYHFVTEGLDKMKQDIRDGHFIEAGQYNSNLYGTSFQAIKDVAFVQKKHCILDVSGKAIRRLVDQNIFPIVIFINPLSHIALTELNPEMSEEEALNVFDKAQTIQRDFQPYFNAVIPTNSYQQIFNQVLNVIAENKELKVWTDSEEIL
ncbi:disks large 1 tumor suppressor protein-like isoform X2 [Gordionus sp. m RMFG-2023]|uniref:disks large 1 tumor suppressor protein-like isoform X2 n=1 Tax=Gordionus sp. m RMFG-2023 TaxID=3053472 RepID=UPI0031FD368B